MKRMVRGTMLVAVMLLTAVTLFAGGAREVDFLAELEIALEDQGLTEAQAQAIVEAAEVYDWQGANRASPELVAEAIVAVVTDGVDLTAEEGAELALELAESEVQLRGEGYDDEAVSQAMLQTVEQLQTQLREWHDGDHEEPLGETVRTMVSETARSQARTRTTGDAEDGDGGPGSNAGSGGGTADEPDPGTPGNQPEDPGAAPAGPGAGNGAGRQ